MPPRSSQEPSPVAAGIVWAHRITTISLEMVLPALGGVWLDNRYNTGPWLFLLGAVLGFSLALYHLIQIGRKSSSQPTDQPKPPKPSANPQSISQFPAAPEPPGTEKTE